MVVGQHGNKVRVGAIVQCRYDSTRLPGKALLNLPFGEKSTILSQIIARLTNSQLFDEVVVATTKELVDAPISSAIERTKAKIYKGSKDNVLERFCEAATYYDLNVVIRLTGDNPLILTDLMQDALEHHITSKAAYTRILKAPVGLGFEIISRDALLKVQEQCDRMDDKEHVTTYIKRHPEQFAISELALFDKVDIPDIRLTVDYPSDYALMNIIFNYLKTKQYNYNHQELFGFLLQYSWLKNINPNYQKRVFNTFQEEKEEALHQLKFLGFDKMAEELSRIDLEKKTPNKW